jgi:hypothetical protein
MEEWFVPLHSGGKDMVVWELLKKFEKYLIDPRMILRVRFYRVEWLPFGAAAITIGRMVLVRYDCQGRNLAAVVAHELKHVEQIEWNGFFHFYYMYLREHLRKGYRLNRYEIVARTFSEFVMEQEFPISEIK